MDAYDPEYAPNHSDAAGRYAARAILAQLWRKSGGILAEFWRNYSEKPPALQVPVLGAAGDG